MLLIDENYPEVLADLARTVHEVLTRKLQLQPEVAGAIAIETAEMLRLRMGGSMVRIPFGRDWERSIRDQQMFLEWKQGASYRELSVRWSLSEVRVRKIIDRQRTLALRRNGLLPVSD